MMAGESPPPAGENVKHDPKIIQELKPIARLRYFRNKIIGIR